MGKIKAGYTAVRCGLETTEDGMAVLEFLRADGKVVLVTMTAENVLALSESLLSLLEKPTEVVVEPDGTERVDVVTSPAPSDTNEETDNGTAGV